MTKYYAHAWVTMGTFAIIAIMTSKDSFCSSCKKDYECEAKLNRHFTTEKHKRNERYEASLQERTEGIVEDESGEYMEHERDTELEEMVIEDWTIWTQWTDLGMHFF